MTVLIIHLTLFKVWQDTSIISGQSTQLVGPGLVCSSDVATYQCTRRGGGSLIPWTVSSNCETGDMTRSFSSYDMRNAVEVSTLCNFTLMLSLTSVTSSSISSTITIDRPVLLNGTRITYNRETVQLFVVTSL